MYKQKSPEPLDFIPSLVVDNDVPHTLVNENLQLPAYVTVKMIRFLKEGHLQFDPRARYIHRIDG